MSIVVQPDTGEKHSSMQSSYIKSIVFGGLDGIITTFSIVAAVEGASLSPEIVLMMGFANLLSDGISMGLGDYLSESAEIEYIHSEIKRETFELENAPDLEKNEMIQIYTNRGVSTEDAQNIILTMMKYKDLFLEHMMIMELGLQIPDKSENPVYNGVITFGSFVIFGSVPMWVYLVMWGVHYDNKDGAFGIACTFTGFTMFLLGMFQARITHQSQIKTGVKLMMNGGLAAAAAYLIGWGLDHALGKGENMC